MTTKIEKYVISSKIGIDMIRLAVNVVSVDVNLLDKNLDGTNGRALYYRGGGADGLSIGAQLYHVLDIAPADQHYHIYYRKGRTGKNVYLELFVRNAGEETIGNFNNRNVADVFDAYQEAKNDLSNRFGVILNNESPTIIYMEINRTVQYPYNTADLLRYLGYIKIFNSKVCVAAEETKARVVGDKNDLDYLGCVFAWDKRSKVRIYTKSSQTERKYKDNNDSTLVCGEAFVRLEFALQQQLCATRKYLATNKLVNLTDKMIWDAYRRLYDTYIKDTYDEYKKMRINALKLPISNISLRHHGRWLADLNNTILHWEYAYITPAALSRRELVQDLGLLNNQAIAKYSKIHRTRLEAYLDDYLPAIATNTSNPEVCMQTFFAAVSPDAPPKNSVLHICIKS